MSARTLVLVVWLVVCCNMLENDRDRSDARTDVLKSNSEYDSDDYEDGYYKSQKPRKDYVPVFVPEEEKKKSMRHIFS